MFTDPCNLYKRRISRYLYLSLSRRIAHSIPLSIFNKNRKNPRITAFYRVLMLEIIFQDKSVPYSHSNIYKPSDTMAIRVELVGRILEISLGLSDQLKIDRSRAKIKCVDLIICGYELNILLKSLMGARFYPSTQKAF